jgi:hypothetical protein
MNNTPTTGAELIDNEYWLGGIWDDEGKLLWSSEPTSYETEEAARNAAETALIILNEPKDPWDNKSDPR